MQRQPTCYVKFNISEWQDQEQEYEYEQGEYYARNVKWKRAKLEKTKRKRRGRGGDRK